MHATWFFRLEGAGLDKETVQQLLADRVTPESIDSGTNLVLELPFRPDQAEEARTVANGLLSKLNGIAQVIHGNHEPVTSGAVSCRDSAGKTTNMIFLAPIGNRRRFGQVTLGSVGSPMPTSQESIGSRFLRAAERDSDFDRALYLYGSLPADWRGLYVVLEAAEDGNGGKRGLIARKWVAARDIKDFKATANSYKAIGREARHGTIKGGGVTHAQQSLTTTRSMIRTIMEKWARALF